MPPGLRERKKLKTRHAIVEAAMYLFAKKGFEQTTVAEIADRAEISPSTFFTYFPTKEEVAFDGVHAELDSLGERLRERPAGVGAIDALRGWIDEMIVRPEFDEVQARKHRQLINSTEALRFYELSHVDPYFEELMAAAVADDLGVPASDLAPQMVAAAASAALRALSVDHGDSDPGQLLDQAVTFLSSGADALRSDQVSTSAAAPVSSGRRS